ncbi:hypothetical protein [Streptomyces sp. YGL11-2]|uniref:hypothetical protein n=1 Tax=Streptomyces sp. YGL11-2 TaxID=3414028 RepID=UPI003CF9C8C9
MTRKLPGFSRRARVSVAGVGTAAAAAAAALLAPNAIGASATSSTGIDVPSGYSTQVFASGGSLSSPDDIALLGGNVFVAYQNGVGAKGEPSSSGQTASTVVEYTQQGHKVAQWNLTGKIDGMTADPSAQRIIATVNEDDNSSLFTLTPGAASGAQLAHYQFSPSPLPHGGGTDSISVVGGALYISASNPSPNADGKTFSGPALYKVTLSGTTATAKPVLKDNSTAVDAQSGKQVTLNLSDPDSNTVVPASAPRFGGDLMLDSQGDSEQIYLANAGTSRQSAQVLKLNTQVDDTAIATSTSGTLYVTDPGTNQVVAVRGSFTPGQTFAAVPDDSKVLAGALGSLNLRTGSVSPFGKGFKSPHGLLFVPTTS